MAIAWIQSLTTPVAVVAFLGVLWWAYGSKSRKKDFDNIAESLFDPDEEATHRATLKQRETSK